MRRLLLTTLAATLLLASPATARTVTTPAAGDFTASVLEVAPHPTPSGDCLIKLTATFAFTGTVDGAFTAPFTILHEGACPPATGEEAFVARGTFAGDVTIGSRTRTGTFDFVFAGTIDEAGNARGILLVLDGTGGLRGLRGALELTGIAGVGGTYRGTLTL
jgi:hypothetical protein